MIPEHALTLIPQDARGPSVNSHINVENVFILDTHNLNTKRGQQIISDQHQMLTAQLDEWVFWPETSIKVNQLEHLLWCNPNRNLVNKVVSSFQTGFLLNYPGPRLNRQPHNLPMAFSFLEKLWASLMKEVKLDCMLGPILVQTLDPLIFFYSWYSGEEELCGDEEDNTLELPKGSVY